MLSVIIPTFNSVANISRLINDIKKTSLGDLEIIVVDDFSSDNTVDVCRTAGAHKVLKLTGHKGPAYARNFGASQASGENLLFIDSDVVLETGRDVIVLVDKIFKENPEIDCIASMSDVQPVTKSPVAYNMSVYHAYYIDLIMGDNQSLHLRTKFFSTRFGGIRKEKYRKSGGLYESLTDIMAEDGEFGYRCYELGYKTCITRLLTHKHMYSTSFKKFAKSYFLAAMVLYFIHRKMDTSPHPAAQDAEKYRRVSGLLMILSPLLLLFFSVKLYCLIMAVWIFLFVYSFGKMNRLIFSQVPVRYWVPWYIVYLAITPVIASGYLLGVIKYYTGTRLFEGAPSKIDFFNPTTWNPPSPDGEECVRIRPGRATELRSLRLLTEGSPLNKFNMIRSVIKGILTPSTPSAAVLFVTNRCNANCCFCFNHQINSGKEKEYKDELSLNDYIQISKKNKPLFQVILGGGEPFLRDDLAQIVEAFYVNSHSRLFSIPTNGSLREHAVSTISDISRKCKEAVINILVSIDACGEKHDELRGLAGAFRNAAGLCDDLIDMKKTFPNINLIVNTVVTEENIGFVIELQDYLVSKYGNKLDYHNLNYDQRMGAKIYSDPACLDKIKKIEQNAAKMSALQKGLMKTLVEKYYVNFLHRLLIIQRIKNKMLYKCNAGKKIFVINYNGEVSPCEPFLLEKRYKNYGHFNIKDYWYDYKKLARSAEYMAFLDLIASKKCHHCSWSCAAITSMLYNPVNWRTLVALPSLNKLI